MDFEKFEKNNRFQLLRNKILRISDGDLVKKDLISGLMLLSIIAYILGTIKGYKYWKYVKYFRCPNNKNNNCWYYTLHHLLDV